MRKFESKATGKGDRPVFVIECKRNGRRGLERERGHEKTKVLTGFAPQRTRSRDDDMRKH
jgi:hypothetical protein